MAMSYENQRHVGTYRAAGNMDAANFLEAQQAAWQAFKKATGTEELPLEESGMRRSTFTIAGKSLENPYIVTHEMLVDPTKTGRIITYLLNPYFDNKGLAKRACNAVLRHVRTSELIGDRIIYSYHMSALDILKMTEEELSKVSNLGYKSVRFFIEATHPLRESLIRFGLLP